MKEFCWSLQGGTLYYGPKGETVYTLTPGYAMNASVGSYSGKYAYSVPEYTPQKDLNECLNLTLKISPNGMYCAVVTEGFLWADLYGLVPREVRDPGEQQFIDQGLLSRYRGEYLFTLKRNTYYTYGTQFILEFGERKVPDKPEPETCFLFNTSHGHLDVYNMKGQKVIDRSCSDIFFIQYRFSDKRKDMIMDVWYWHPVEGVAYYDFQRLFDDPTYTGSSIEVDDGVFFDRWINQKECIYQLTNKRVYQRTTCIDENPDFSAAVEEIEKDYHD
jgi:hypothetical protein